MNAACPAGCHGNTLKGGCVLPQCCHSVAQLVYHSTEQQSDEEVGQLTGGQIDTWDLKTHEKLKKETEL